MHDGKMLKISSLKEVFLPIFTELQGRKLPVVQDDQKIRLAHPIDD